MNYNAVSRSAPGKASGSANDEIVFLYHLNTGCSGVSRGNYGQDYRFFFIKFALISHCLSSLLKSMLIHFLHVIH